MLTIIVIENVPLFLLLTALFTSTLVILRHPHAMQNKYYVLDTFMAYLLLFPVGINCVWTFIMNTFLANQVLSLIDWGPQPFQFEFAVANLSIGATAIIAFRETFEFRLAIIITAGIYLWGCAISHIKQILLSPFFNLEHVGSALYIDLIIPFVLFSLVFARFLATKPSSGGT